MTDLLLDYRRRVAEGVAAALNGIDYSHADLLRHEAVHAEAVHLDLMAAAACLYAAEALGGDAEAALPPATALALLETMADVFRDISEEGYGRSPGLLDDWGMPRTLNAGDALFVLAQQRVLDTSKDATVALSAAERLDLAARDLCESLPSASVGNALLPAAMSLAALSSGSDAETAERFADLGHAIAAGRGVEERLAALELDPAQHERLQELTTYLSEVRAE